MKPGNTKIGTRIWAPLLAKFTARIDSACLRRDTWLTKVLANELDELDAETPEPNSEAARQFIAAHLDTVPRKLVTFTLPEPLVSRLDDICERKRIVRDSFFNRLLFLLTANHRQITRLFFDGDREWLQDLLEGTDFSSSAVGDLLDPIPDFRHPFRTTRDGLMAQRDRLAKEPGQKDAADEWIAEHSIYNVMIADRTFGDGLLYGLSIYLPDTLVPGTAEHQRAQALLDDLLPADQPPTEQTP